MFKRIKPYFTAFALLLLPCMSVSSQILEAVDFSTDNPGSSNVNNMVVSPDSRHLYALSGSDGTLASYTISQQTGNLTQFDVQMVETNVFPASAVSQFTPDGRFLYLRRFSGTHLMLYSRNLSSGLIQLVDTNIANIPDNLGTRRFTLSPDGQNLYLLVLGDTVELRVHQVNADGTLKLLQTIDLGDNTISFPQVSPDGRHLYISGSPNPFFARNPTDGTLQLINNELTPNPIFSSLLFTADSTLFLFGRGFIGSPPSFGLSYFERDTQSGGVLPPSSGVLSSPSIINSGQLFSLIDNDRFLVQSAPLRLFRFIREAGASFIVEDGIVDNLSSGSLHDFTSQTVSPNGRFYFLGLEDGITVFSVNGTGIGIPPEVPALNPVSLLFLGLLVLACGILTLTNKSSIRH